MEPPHSFHDDEGARGGRSHKHKGGGRTQSSYANPQVEDYLKKLNGSLFLMAGKVRRGIVDEARDHIYTHISSRGEHPMIVEDALMEYGNPKELARDYKKIHGYTVWLTVAMAGFVLLLAIFSVPFVFFNAAGSVLSFILIVVLTLVASMFMGKRSGLTVGVTAMVVRILGLMLLSFVAGLNDMLVVDGGGAIAIVISSLLLPVIGYAPGRTLEHFERKQGESFEMF